MTSKILLVEDETTSAKYLKQSLRSYGIGVDYYENIEDLRDNYKNLNDYKVVFIDVRLDKNGWNVSGKDILKEMLNVSDIPFYVIWTAYGTCLEAEECLEMGASLIMSKDGNVIKIYELANYIDKLYEPVYGYVSRPA